MKSINDLVAVTFIADAEQLQLQSYSMDKFISNPITHWVIVQDHSKLDYWHSILDKFYTRHQLKIIPSLLDNKFYEFNSTYKSGYQRQQLLKLMIADCIDSESYLVLDSKDFFIKSIDLADWPYSNGSGIILPYGYESSLLKNWMDFATVYHNLKKTDYMFMIGTPFLFQTKVVKQLLKLKIQDTLFNLTVPTRAESEFALYSIFYQHIVEKLEPSVDGINKYPKYQLELEDFDKTNLEEKYSRPYNLMFGIHRTRFNSLTIKNFKTLIDFLIEKDFSKDILETILTNRIKT